VKSIVIYYSETGNTQQVAQAVAAGLKTQVKKIEEINAQELTGYDLICIGTPVQGGAPAPKVAAFISRMPATAGKKAAVFCTMHMFGDKKAIQRMEKALENKGMLFVGSFTALGWSRLVANFGPRIFNRGRPSRNELARAEEFGRDLQAKI
jgi:flavodoxin I